MCFINLNFGFDPAQNQGSFRDLDFGENEPKTQVISSALLASVSSSQSDAQKVRQIDRQIEELKDMKRGFEARALRHDNMAEWLQFDDKAYLETRRHLEIADENREKAAAVQQEIDRLEKEKQELLRKK